MHELYLENVEGKDELVAFAKNSTDVDFANEIDTRALRSINQILKNPKRLLSSTFDEKSDPFKRQLKGSTGRTRKPTQKMKEAKSLQEMFLERKKKRNAAKKRGKKSGRGSKGT